MKKKLVRNVSLVALSAVLCCGAAAAFTGCKKGGSGTYELTVDIFCDDTDKLTNQKICDDWAAEYTQQLRAEGKIPEDATIKVTFTNNPNKDEYFTALDNNFSTGVAADIIYLAPKYVKAWTSQGRVMDITEYITNTADRKANLDGIWQDALAFYGYTNDPTDVPGHALTFKDGKYYTADTDKPVGIYGLPKDYSNFSMGFNNRYFSANLREAYTHRLADTTRNISLRKPKDPNIKFTGEGDTFAVTYAVNVPADKSYDGQAHQAGDPAPLINIGIPTTYHPYNFYAYSSYQAAQAAGDPVAVLGDLYTNGEGYTVTIPGFPGDTFELPSGTATDTNALYDNRIGHVVYTYAEFSALTWAVTYYCNTFNMEGTEASGYQSGADLSGTGGVKTGANASNISNVYGGDQYEGAPNPTLYLLPWLAGNDANFINSASTKATQDIPALTATSTGGTATENVKKLRLNGQKVDVPVQYGVNSERFIETYGAFLAYASDWNGNSSHAGSESSVKTDNGWSLFRAGAEIFYGSGTWDAKTKNESNPEYTQVRQMPMPVGEKYALYSTVKNGYYKMQTYHAESGTDAEALHIYTEDQIKANLANRQDKWAARMDSVGFAANANLLKTATGKSEWKLQGAADLIMRLTSDANAQRDLTYGGAQIPNFRQQCVEFLEYQAPTYQKTDSAAGGSFVDMLTPEGFSDTGYYVYENGKVKIENGHYVTNPAGVAKAAELWKAYCDLAGAMSVAGDNNGDQLVKDFIASYQASDKWTLNEDIRYDTQYAESKLKEVLTGELSSRATAMKILRMTTFTKADRDLNVRTQYGLNSVRDSAMYTYQDAWILAISMRDGSSLAYINQDPSYCKNGNNLKTEAELRALVITDPSSTATGLLTPAVFCLRAAGRVAELLQTSIQQEMAVIYDF